MREIRHRRKKAYSLLSLDPLWRILLRGIQHLDPPPRNDYDRRMRVSRFPGKLEGNQPYFSATSGGLPAILFACIPS